MVDVLTKQQRSLCMSRIRGTNTGPELLVRKLSHAMGYRFRLHQSDLPGKPDLVFAGRRKVVFVHGCFWHMHDCRYGRVVPRTNAVFWETKRRSNQMRDGRQKEALEAAGWTVLVVWECWTKDVDGLTGRLKKFLTDC